MAALVVAAQAMTVSQDEAAEVPAELRPIVPGGSWFDDMALERLRTRHRHLKEIGGSTTEEDPEEKFIMARLKDPELKVIEKEPEPNEPPRAALKAEDTREALRSFMRQHKERGGDGGGSHGPAQSSREFMEIYERELQKFFKNFMSVMLQAEIGGVSIENRSEEERKEVEGLAGAQHSDHTEFNAVATP